MAYNLLLDTKFKDNNWKCVNCSFNEDGVLISNDKVFGIAQELILPDPTKLYFRCEYMTKNEIEEVNIGIQSEDVLEINRKSPKINTWQKISVIDDVKQEKIVLHIIFESKTKENIVKVKNPILIDLNYLNKSRWLRCILDNVIKYRYGYSYENIYKDSELKEGIDDFKGLECVEGAKIGSIIKTNEEKTIKISAKFKEDKYYLVKLDYKEINKFGNVYITYGVLKSTYFKDEQLYLLFKSRPNLELELHLESTAELPYQINLKHLLIIEAGRMNLLKSDIPYLPFL